MNIEEIVYSINDITSRALQRSNQEKIYDALFDELLSSDYVVIADSDADGLCSARIWREYTRTKAPFHFLDRTNRNPLDIAKSIDPSKTIVCLDCGSSVDWSNIPNKVYVIDHHESQMTCLDVTYINPKMDFGDTTYCTSTLVYALFEANTGTTNKTAIQYAAIAGVADMVPMLDDNRDIVKRGFAEMNEKPCDIAKQYPPFRAKYDEIHVGFTIAPLINAPSRLGKLSVAVDAVVYADKAQIKALQTINNNRKTLVKNIVKNAAIRQFEHCIIAEIQSGGAAVSGLVANKLLGEYHKPVMCIDGTAVSFRSKTVDVERFITSHPTMIVGGGHKQAAGGQINQDALEDVMQLFVVYCEANTNAKSDEISLYDVFVDGKTVSQTKKPLMSLKPFGQGFKAPTFGAYFNVYQIGKDFSTTSVDSGYTTLKLKSDAYVFNAVCFAVPSEIELGKEYFFIFDITENLLIVKGIENE